MAENVVSYSDFDIGQLNFTAYKQNGAGRGGSVANVYGGTGKSLHLQTPVGLRVPFGVSVYPDSDPPKKSIDYDMAGQEAFVAVVRAVEEKAKEFAIANSQQLFGISDPEEAKAMCRFNFRSSIKPGKPPYSDTYKTSVESRGFNDQVMVFVALNKEKSRYGVLEDVEKNCTVTSIVELKSLWVVDGKFGVKWVTSQVKVYGSAKKLSESPVMAIQDGSVLVTDERELAELEEPAAKRRCVPRDPEDFPEGEGEGDTAFEEGDEPPPEAHFEEP